MTALVLVFTIAAAQPTEPSTATTVGYAAAATGTVALSTAIALAAGVLVHSLPYEAAGRPSPWVTTGALAVSLAINAALTHFVVPWLAQVLRGSPEITAVRMNAWEHSRWVLVGGAVSVVTFAVGAGLEQSAFGRGQAVMLVGALMTIAALFVWDVVEAIASWRT